MNMNRDDCQLGTNICRRTLRSADFWRVLGREHAPVLVTLSSWATSMELLPVTASVCHFLRNTWKRCLSRAAAHCEWLSFFCAPCTNTFTVLTFLHEHYGTCRCRSNDGVWAAAAVGSSSLHVGAAATGDHRHQQLPNRRAHCHYHSSRQLHPLPATWSASRLLTWPRGRWRNAAETSDRVGQCPNTQFHRLRSAILRD